MPDHNPLPNTPNQFRELARNLKMLHDTIAGGPKEDAFRFAFPLMHRCAALSRALGYCVEPLKLVFEAGGGFWLARDPLGGNGVQVGLTIIPCEAHAASNPTTVVFELPVEIPHERFTALLGVLRIWGRDAESRAAELTSTGGGARPAAITADVGEFHSAAWFELKHGIRRSRISEAVSKKLVRVQRVPPGYADVEGRTATRLYHVEDVLKNLSPKRR